MIRRVPRLAAPASSRGGRSRAWDRTSRMGNKRPLGLQNEPWAALPSDPVVPISPAGSGLSGGCSTAPSLGRLLAPRERLILRKAHEQGTWHAWHCLVKGPLLKLELILSPAPGSRAAEQGSGKELCTSVRQAPCFRPSRVLPAELHEPALKSTEMTCTTLCTSSAAGGEKKEHFLQTFPIHWAKSRPGVSQGNAQRSCIRMSLPCRHPVL